MNKFYKIFLLLCILGMSFGASEAFANSRAEKQNKNTAIAVKGKVVDENGGGLPGVSVLEKGQNRGTTTDVEGNFAIDVNDAQAVLVFSFVGYETQEILVGSQSQLRVEMKPSFSNLSEVVVIGYGEQSRSKVVGAVGKMEAEELKNVTAISLDQQLAGKMSGVVINQSNGQPGESAQIVIRGTGTLTAGSNPLIVVDGFPLTEGSSLNSINPNDIADINVLKDAASAAIYGSRAANGVILVTTKQGKNGQKTALTFDAYTGFQQQSSGVKLVDAYDMAVFLTEARNWGYVSKDPTNRSESDPNSVRVTKKINGKSIDGRELFLDYLQPYLDRQPGLVNTNWMDEAFRTAPMSNYGLSYSGGNSNTRFYSSMGYFNQKGVVAGTDIVRYSASFSLNSKINDKINFGFNIKPTFTDQNSFDQSSRSSGALALLPLNFPFYTAYKADGSLNISDQLVNEQHTIEGVAINGTPVENLAATAALVKDNKLRYKSFGNVYLNAELLQNLTYKLSLGGDYDTYVTDYYYPIGVGSYRTPAPRSDANATQGKLNTFNYLVENTLTYKFGNEHHNFNALAGYTFQKENGSYSKITGTGFPDDNIKNISGASAYSVSNSVNIWTLESYLARLQYDYDAKYLLSLAIRRDGSSRFGMNNRWGNFPSLSAGWVFSREGFFPQSAILSFGKLSASWGQTGNNQIGSYGSQALVTASNYVFGSSIAPGYISTTAPNPNLGWEVASSTNIGLDLGFFNNRLNLSSAYYKTNTRDLLLDVPVPQQTGYNSVLANIGEMENQGFENQISANGLKLGNVSLGFNANITTYKNKVLALGPGQDRIATGTDQNFVTQVGHPIAEIYGYVIDGVYKTQDEINSSPHLDGTLKGDYRVIDVNKDGVIDVNDKVSKGTYAPKMTYGFGSTASYKGFTFGFNFVGVAGRTLLDGDMSSLTEAGEGFAVPTQYYFDHRYHPVDNPNGFLGQPNFGNFSNARKLVRSSIVVQENNGAYFRLRDVRLAYDFSREVLQKLKLSALQLYVSGNNVFTATKFRGWNPDGTSSNILTSGYNTGGNYPVAKTFTAGLKVSY
ncbi:TonB-dependent receptor [Marinilongibacter aquaticus]|uniref:SusC/RagA family TonB-linked outer membrane protein n=1 Tax=Marinilongibacter aquaticus TaxID=2975157 RepID=UPI0021BD54DB|nr:TonB-dependent receptor [Marinilongibacter aquaticus]UBM58622.1 TonB-dependent receptor [Marinilongibacter aquaticus]